MIVDVETLKEQMRVDHDDEDDLIGRKIEAAQNHIERMLGFEIEVEFADTTVPPSLVEAVCQLAAHWYENREAVLVGVTAQALPIGVQDILREYRNWSF